MEEKAHLVRIIWLLVPVLTVILGKSIETPAPNLHRHAIDMRTDLVSRSHRGNQDFSELRRLRHSRQLDIQDNKTFSPKGLVHGMRIEYDSSQKRVNYLDSGKIIVTELMYVRIRIYGNFNNDSESFISFTKVKSKNAGACNVQHSTPEAKVNVVDEHMGWAMVQIPGKADLPHDGYLCFRNSLTEGESVLQGPKDWLTIELEKRLLPLWLHILCLMFLLCLSGLFSGLNLGLMSLNKTDLKIIINTGTTAEKRYASKIAPVRNHGNFLLCCLLFSNVLVNTTLTILMDDVTSGEIAILMSTLAIVIFGEIIPQAICSRHGLAVGAKTISITKFFMFITFPLAYPLSKILDKVLGEEIGSVYTRERLKELLRVTKDHHGLENEEVGIISGALDMKTKTVKDVMKKLEEVFMLSSDAILNFDTMAEIEYHGYSRIPIYEGERSNIVALLNVKQLTLLDPSDNIPLKTVIEFHQNQLFYVFDHNRLDYMFRAFREGNRGHMAFVQKVNNDGPGDPYYETVGIVTMEDVLEELLQAEIMDESDVGKLQARVAHTERPKNIPFLLNKKAKQTIDIPPSLAIAAVQFLSSSVEPFKKEYMSVNILERLMRTTIVFLKAPKMKHHEELKKLYIYEQGKPCDYFVMILEGRVKVCVGQEKMIYESGPFTVFGADFLMANQREQRNEITEAGEPTKNRPTYAPDYSVRVVTDVTYFRLKIAAYRAATVASELARAYRDSKQTTDEPDWENEIEKVLNDAEDETIKAS